MKKLGSTEQIKVPLGVNQHETDIRSVLQQFQDLGLLDTVDALEPFAYNGHTNWQTSEWFVNTNNWAPVMEKILAAMTLVSQYPDFLHNPYTLETDTYTLMFDDEKIFRVSNYPEIMSHIRGDLEFTKLILASNVGQMRDMLQKYTSLATGKPYKRKLEGVKSELISIVGFAKSTNENTILADPLWYNLNPIEYTNTMLSRWRRQGYIVALVRMIDVLYGSGEGRLPRQ